MPNRLCYPSSSCPLPHPTRRTLPLADECVTRSTRANGEGRAEEVVVRRRIHCGSESVCVYPAVCTSLRCTPSILVIRYLSEDAFALLYPDTYFKNNCLNLDTIIIIFGKIIFDTGANYFTSLLRSFKYPSLQFDTLPTPPQGTGEKKNEFL